jgi:hypothetical protein
VYSLPAAGSVNVPEKLSSTLDVPLGHFGPIVVADEEAVDDRNILAADKANRIGLGDLGGNDADEEGALPVLGHAGSRWAQSDSGPTSTRPNF